MLGMSGAAIANTRLAHGRRPYAGLDGPLWHMPVAHQTLAAIIRRQMSINPKSLGDFGFYSLSQQSTRPHCAELRSADRKVTRLAQGDDGMSSMAHQSFNGYVAGSHRHDTPPPLPSSVTNFPA